VIQEKTKEDLTKSQNLVLMSEVTIKIKKQIPEETKALRNLEKQKDQADPAINQRKREEVVAVHREKRT